MSERRGIKSGDLIRLYGYPGRFVAEPCTSYVYGDRGLWVRPEGEPESSGFPAHATSVVELNGVPLPLLSAPLVPPADDYPHVPRFDYTDGPQELAQDALAKWQAGVQDRLCLTHQD